MAESTDASDSLHDGLWIDEQIWGHRLHDEQSPWLTFLEFITVFHAHGTAALTGNRRAGEQLSYTPQRQMRLRNILFNNPHFVELGEMGHLSSDEAWLLWRTRMARNPSGVPGQTLDFTDLAERFPDFQDFVRVVEYLRRTAVEGLANKRWTTRFVFPFGARALYEDVREKGASFQTDRLFFARTGELLYLMLCRSAQASALASALTTLFFQQRNPSERLVGILQGATAQSESNRTGAVLPHEKRPEFDALAEDWLSLLRRGMPGLDVVPHLVTIGALHLWRYLLNIAAERLNVPRPEVIIEMVSSQRTSVRALSVESYDRNNALPWRAVEAMLRDVQLQDRWTELSSGPGWRERLFDYLEERFHWPEAGDRVEHETSPADGILASLIKEAKRRHDNHIGKIHSTWAREMGLASRRSSRRVRYAPTDRLLKTLVLAHVESRMEMKRFLATLNERYGFVVSDIEGSRWIGEGEADKEDFKRNAQRMEDRLASLGLAERLSDACAFVQSTVGLGA
jgi:hypothetical protein